MRTSSVGLAVTGLLCAACLTDVDPGLEPAIRCSGPEECPDGFSCDLEESLCVRGQSVAERPAPPEIRLARSSVVGGRFVNEVEVQVEIDDPNFPVGDRVELAFAFSTQGDEGPWEPLTLAETSAFRDGPLLASTEAVLIWDAVSDANPTSLPLMDDPTGENGAIVGLTPRVWIRATATDASAREASALVEVGPIGNSLPQALLAPFEDEFYNGSIPLRVGVRDESADRCDIEVQFRAPGETEFRRAAVPPELATDVNAGIDSGITSVLIWQSLAPPNSDPEVAQGVGREAVPSVDFRVRAVDDPSGALAVFGPWSPVVVLPQVRNQTPPRITNIAVRRLGQETGTSPILLTFDLIDAESDPVDLRADISPARSTSFVPLPEYPLPSSEGLLSLAASADGTSHRLALDPSGVRWPAQAVVVRLTASDGFPEDAPRTTTASFTVPAADIGLVSETFAPQIFERPNAVFGTAIADVNGDGSGDLVFSEDAGTSFDRLRVYPSRGTSLEARSASALFGGASSDVDGCDIDDDGLEEVLVRVDTTFLLYDADEDATLSFSRSVSTGITFPIHAYFEDVDGDGACDLVSLNSSEVSVRLGVGDGTFGTADVADFSPPESFFDPLVAADVDGDGSAEFFNFSFAPDRLEIWDGDIENLSSFVQLDDGEAILPSSLTAADLDGDGADELVLGQLDVIRVYRENPSGTPLVETASFIDSPGANNEVATGDFDGDSNPDVATLSWSAREIRVYRGRGDLSFEPLLRLNVGQGERRLRIGDVDGDGVDDIGLVDQSRDELTVYRSGSGGLTRFNEVLPQPFVAAARAAAVGDLNRDGLPDVVAVRADFAGVSLFLSETSGGVATPEFSAKQIELPTTQTSVGIEDFDRDGYAEIVTRDVEGETLTVIANPLGSSVVAPPLSVTAPSNPESLSRESVMQLADLTGDGVRDVIVQAGKSVQVFRGAAALEDLGAIDLSRDLPSDDDIADIAVGRLDPDARPDLVVLATDDSLRVYFGESERGLLPERFSAPWVDAIGPTEQQLVIADMSQDGSPNVLIPANPDVLCFEATARLGVVTCDAGGSEPITDSFSLFATDYNDDGAPDLVFQVSSDPLFVRLQALDGAVPSGQFTTLSSGSFADTSITVRIVDFTGDGVDDLVFAGSDGDEPTDGGVLRFQPGSRAAREPRTLPVATLADDVAVVPVSNRLPASARPDTTVIFQRGAGDTSLGMVVPQPNLTAISAPLMVEGDARIIDVPPSIAGVVPAGVRRRVVVPRLGTESEVVAGISVRSGLSVEEGRTVTFPLPLSRSVGTIATSEIRLYRARMELSRAIDYPADPMFGTPLAPLLLPVLGIGGNPRVVVESREQLEEISATGGESFELDTTVDPPVLWVTVERLGTFRAYRIR